MLDHHVYFFPHKNHSPLLQGTFQQHAAVQNGNVIVGIDSRNPHSCTENAQTHGVTKKVLQVTLQASAVRISRKQGSLNFGAVVLLKLKFLYHFNTIFKLMSKQKLNCGQMQHNENDLNSTSRQTQHCKQKQDAIAADHR